MTLADDARRTREFHAEPAASGSQRDWWQAMKRGFAGRCPHCGEGRMFRAYLKNHEACENCGEELHHHRADDMPPYVTIFLAGHIVGGLMLLFEDMGIAMSVWTSATVWPLAGLATSVVLLPKVKGALIAYQWALRMHGFETAKTSGKA